MDAGLSQLRIDRIDSLDELRDEWNNLGEVAGGVFATWEWTDAWWRRFGESRELALFACRGADGRLAAVVPLYYWRRRPIRVLRFLGHGPGDDLGPAYRAGDEAAAAVALRAALKASRFDVFLGEQLPGAGGWGGLLGARPWRREASPVLRVPPGGWSAYLRSRSGSFRAQLRRRSRALERTGASYRLAVTETLERDLDTLFSLHRARWAGRMTAFADDPFHRQVASAALARGWLRLWLLELNGTPVAAWHGFHVGGVTSYYQAGRDPGYDKLSAGFVLLAHTLRAAIEEGATEYRFGRGAEAFKFRFTDEDPGLDSVALARGIPGQVTLGAALAYRQMRLAAHRVSGAAMRAAGSTRAPGASGTRRG
jgi:CelD/BcsL family acetyltransferase involved in cellulose biosynthesis